MNSSMSNDSEWMTSGNGVVMRRIRMGENEVVKHELVIINAVKQIRDGSGVMTRLWLDLISIDDPCKGAIACVPTEDDTLMGPPHVKVHLLMQEAVMSATPWICYPSDLLGRVVVVCMRGSLITDITAGHADDIAAAVEIGFQVNPEQLNRLYNKE